MMVGAEMDGTGKDRSAPGMRLGGGRTTATPDVLDQRRAAASSRLVAPIFRAFISSQHCGQGHPHGRRCDDHPDEP